MINYLIQIFNKIMSVPWLIDAVKDSINVVPFLFFAFLFIELIEYFCSDKINNFLKKSEKYAPVAGTFAAVIPQCGFSVLASTLYLRKYITKGTLIAIYLATSDEAIPILLSYPDKIYYILPIISVKVIIAILCAYIIDYVLKDKKYIFNPDSENCNLHSENDGCCSHSVSKKRKRDLIFHPVKHTLNIFIFILIITLLLNYFIEISSQIGFVHILYLKSKIFQPVIFAVLGLIPNCAISITVTMLLIKGIIGFPAAISGLLSNAGLGILVLIRHKENYKDTLNIIFIILFISILSGYIFQISKYIFSHIT